MKASELKTGDVIQFTAVPYGSYASVLVAYKVEVVASGRRETRSNRSIRLVNVGTGSSTYDSLSAWRGAAFEKIN